MSRFSSVLKTARERPAAPTEAEPVEPAPSPAPPATIAAATTREATPPAPDPRPAATVADLPPALPRPRGRPPGGKRSDPDHAQVTAYIPRRLHRAVQRKLLDEAEAGNGRPREFSILVAELLERWVDSPR